MKENENSKPVRNSNIQQSPHTGQSLQNLKTTSTASRPEHGVGLNDCPREEITQEELNAVALITRAWSGILPPPEDFNAYSKDAQSKIIEWNDAQILEESQRQNKIVHQMCKDTTRSAWFSFITNILPIIVAGVLFAFTREAVVFSLLSIPAITIGGNFIQIIIDEHKSDKDE